MSNPVNRLREAWALVRATALTAASYRFGMLMKLGIVVFQAVPAYYIGITLQPFMANRISGEGGEYFGFLLLGTVAFFAVGAAVDALPRAVESATTTGTLEALLATPVSVPTLLAGLAGYELLWALARSAVYVAIGALLGAHLVWANTLPALAILLLIALAYYPVGLVVAALVIAYRRPGPVQTLVIVAAGFFGGVSYPVGMIPAQFRPISILVPLSYGLRALRRVLLDGASITAVAPDVAILGIFIVAGFAVGTGALALALAHARRAGSLAQY